MSEPLSARREMLKEHVLPALGEPIRHSPELKASLSDLIAAVTAQGLEGLIAKRLDSRYEPGQRSGAWQKMRINRGQEFVIGGYTTGGKTFYALIFGYYDGDRLIYAARTRAGFTPATREHLCRKFWGLEISECPFANLPEKRAGRWGQGLTADKMQECRWLLCRMRHSNHNAEYRTMPHAFWRMRFWKQSALNSASVAVLLIGIVRGLKVAQK